ncbi:MAG: type II toxin-antitoxin system MqsR family toxin [Nitrospirae bacterium]|nr:type II toxin-antitoxin system MqsR family toxin [Nitrospirota bacterium]
MGRSNSIALKEDIEHFLKNFKSCWDGSVIPRINSNNDDTLAILGITPKHRMEEIRSLKVEDYYKGPSPDYDGITNKEWWEFGKYVYGYEIYIKVAVYCNKGRCMSFHFPEHKITYPYKKKG